MRSVAQSGRALGLGPRGRRFESYHSDHLIMNKAKIYQPTKTAMQSGLGKTENWILEFETENTGINPLMGWESSIDTLSEVKLKFSTKDSAINYAKKNNIDYYIIKPQKRKTIKKSYTDNFIKNQ